MDEKHFKRKAKLFESTAFTKYLPAVNAGMKMAIITGMLLAGLLQRAHAFNLYDGTQYGNNLEINLTTTLSYTPIFRTSNPSGLLISPANQNDSEGDLNFQHGLVSNLFDVLPVLDIKDGDYGAHFSGDAYLNTSYLGTNQNDQPSTLNPFTIAKSNDFTSATRNINGENARLLDAFVYGSRHFGTDSQQTLTVKVGRQTLLWGQSLFLASNGIAAGMAPIDILTADNNPNAQTQQIIEPVGQVVVTYQPNRVLTLQAYYQFQWEPDYFEGVGAYFSGADFFDKGGQRFIFSAPAGPEPGVYSYRTNNINPGDNNGQFGASAQLTLGNYDVGFYGLRYDEKAPALYFYNASPTFMPPNSLSVGSYKLVYPRDIWIEGTAVSTTVGPANVAAEMSFRQHMDLANLGTFPTAANNVNGNPSYPVGDTWAAQTSVIYLSPGIPLDPGGISFLGEIGFNHVLKVTANANNLSSVANGTYKRSPTAAQLQTVVTPTYFPQILPNLEVDIPIGFAYDFYGRSEVDQTENNGTGSANIGIKAIYRVTWSASVTYNDYFGAPKLTFEGEPGLADRDYVLLNIQHTF